jgi:hypothetical protein
MADELTCRRDCARISCAEHDIIKSTLDQLNDLLTGLGLRALSLGDETTELTLTDTIIVAKLLLLFELTSIVRVFTTTAITVLSRRVRATLTSFT